MSHVETVCSHNSENRASMETFAPRQFGFATMQADTLAYALEKRNSIVLVN